jgi:hypothetical protein
MFAKEQGHNPALVIFLSFFIYIISFQSPFLTGNVLKRFSSLIEQIMIIT